MSKPVQVAIILVLTTVLIALAFLPLVAFVEQRQ